MLWQRLITGPLLILAILGIVWIDARVDAASIERGLPPGLVLAGLLVVLSVLIAREVAAFLRATGAPVSGGVCAIAAMLGLVGTAGSTLAQTKVGVAGIVATALALILLLALLRMSRDRDPKGSLLLVGGALLAGVYGGVLPGFWALIRLEHTPWLLVAAILTTKSSDIGAYFTGMTIGRHKMIPWLSPKKTWEGLLGGIVFAAAVGGVLAHFSAALPQESDRYPWWVGAVAGALAAVVGQAGDLAESAFKRDAGLKDSGRILPGMGGVLDVLDSPLFTGPLFYWLLRLAPHV